MPPIGDSKTLPSLPFPPICFSETTRLPSRASSANVLAISLVDTTLS